MHVYWLGEHNVIHFHASTGNHGDSIVKQAKSNYVYAAATRRRVTEKLTDIKSDITKAEHNASALAGTLAKDMAATKVAVATVAEVFKEHLPTNAMEVIKFTYTGAYSISEACYFTRCSQRP